MPLEQFQPISVKSPSKNPILFWIRCLFDLQLSTIVKYLRPAMSNLQGNILDVGAGESPWREWLPKGCIYHGIDIENASEFGMHKNTKDITYYNGDIMPFSDHSFDGAICIEVLEHVKNPDEFIFELSRVLKNGATLLLTTPWSARRHHIPNDYHRFTRERLFILLNNNGFSNINIFERGSDIGVIANKLIVLTIRLIKPHSITDCIWTIPLAIIISPVVAIMLVIANISERLGLKLGSKDDPLGYFICAKCSST